MSKKYEVCPDSVQGLCRKIMEESHNLLMEFCVQVICLFVSDEDKNGKPKPALKLHGRPCYATVRKVSDRDRAAGMPNAVISIDKHCWYSLGENKRAALLDHELTHLRVDDVDDEGRPVLAMRHYDWELYGFSEVVKRHGIDAVELVEIGSFKESDDGQQVFKFLNSRSAGDEQTGMSAPQGEGSE
jgi:hypothetical protein